MIVLCILGHFFHPTRFLINLFGMFNRMIDFIQSHIGNLYNFDILRKSPFHPPCTCPFEFLWASLAPACFDSLEGLLGIQTSSTPHAKGMVWGREKCRKCTNSTSTSYFRHHFEQFHQQQEPVISWHSWGAGGK